MSSDVTERYTPRTRSQYCQNKYGGPFVRLLQLQPKVAENPSFEQEEFLCALSQRKTKFRFRKRICANESLHDGGAEVPDCRRNRKQGKRVYCQHMLHYGISGHFQAVANVLKRRIKSVSPEKKINK